MLRQVSPPTSSLAGSDRTVRERSPLWMLGFAVLLVGVAGCSRSFWRQNADDNAYDVLSEKGDDPRWCPPRTGLVPDDRSRFFDPYDPDQPPLPPDDPAAHEYMHWMGGQRDARAKDKPWPGGVFWGPFKWVRGFRGYRGWHKYGDTLSVENPQWLDPFMLNPDVLREKREEEPDYLPRIENLTLRQANELALIHSRDFQNQVENLYLAALALTFDRFQFKVRYLGVSGQRPTAVLTQESIPKTSDSLTLASRLGIRQLLPTGGQYAVELANNTLWLFSTDKTNTASTLSYSLVQPLLFGAGRKVVLENLTQSERNLLYATRNFARFRQSFFTQVVGGSGGGSLPGNTALVSSTASGGTGFLGLLRTTQSIRNQRLNIQMLNEQVDRLRSLAAARSGRPSYNLPKLPEGFSIPDAFEGKLMYSPDKKRLYWSSEEMSSTEMDQLLELSADDRYREAVYGIYRQINATILTTAVTTLQSSIANGTNTLLTSEVTLKDQLDNYKIQMLGLPPDLILTIDDQLLKPFELIDPDLTAVQVRLQNAQKERIRVEEDNPRLQQLRPQFEELSDTIRDIGARVFPMIDADFKRLEQRFAERLAELRTPTDVERVKSEFDYDKLQYQTYRDGDFKLEKERFSTLAGVLKKKDISKEDLVLAFKTFKEIQENVLSIIQSLTVIQINIRVQLIPLNSFKMSMEEATQTGLENRLDLMNSRANVMDARRDIEVSANQLRAILNLVMQGDIKTRTTNTQPLEFIGQESSFRAGLNFTAPLDQVSQRNAYRASQIQYQRAKRDYMLAEDQVKFSVRSAWRQIDLAQNAFEISRISVRTGARGFDQAVLQTKDPSQNVDSINGLQLINALSNVLTAQTSLINNWISYETNRLNIHRDMGIMFIDETGLWNDEYYLQMENSSPDGVVNESVSRETPPSESPAPPAEDSTDRSNEPQPAPKATDDDAPRPEGRTSQEGSDNVPKRNADTTKAR